MAPSRPRRRKAARNLAFAETAFALAKDPKGRGAKQGRSRVKLLLLGLVAAAGGAALLKREKVAGLLPSRSGTPEPPAPPAPPMPSNYDAPGPPANTATPVPAPDPQEPEAIDEAAEEAAAAAEAAAIGGEPSEYAGPVGETATQAELPLAEAGEGESEGLEQAEAELEENAEQRDDAPSDAERQIDDAIEAAAQPSSGETPEPLASEAPDPVDEPDATAGEPTPSEAAAGAEGAPEDPDAPKDDDDWRTWSGKSVSP